MEKYGVLFEKIYSAEGILLYIVSDIKKGHISEKDSYFYDEIDNCYLTIDDFEMTYSNDKFAVGYVKTLEEIKKELPKLENTKDILSAYFDDMAEYIYMGKYIPDDDEEYIQIVPLNIDFLSTLSDDKKIMECINSSVGPNGKTIYTLEDKTIDRLLKLKTKEELIEELQSIKSLGTVNLPDSKTNRQVNIVEEEPNNKKINSKELYDILTNRVINQESAIKDIVSTLAIDQYSTCTAERTRCLLVGPTGCGKSEIIRTIANYLDKPFVHIDSAQLTQQGYVGRDIEDFLIRLIDKANGDIKKAENGILVLDEIDKKGSSSNGDVSGRGVLNMLLQLLDGTEYTLKEDGFLGKSKTFNTSNLTIFAAGAFTDVIKGKSKVEKSIGFNSQKVTPKSTIELKPEDFIKYGMMTDEFMGRFQVITELNALDKETLEKILLTSTASPLKAEINKLKKMGIKLIYEDGYIKAVAEQALLLKTGARSLKSIIEKSIKEARFEVIMNPEIYSSIKLLKESPMDSKAYKLYKKKGR